MGHVKSNNIAQAHGNFGLHRKTISYGCSVLDTEADTHAFNPIMGNASGLHSYSKAQELTCRSIL